MSEQGGQTSYETRDAQAKPLVALGVGLTAMMLLALLASSWIVASFQSGREARDPQHPMRDSREAPDDPVLQADPTTEIKEHRAENQALLKHYGWVDRSNGVVRIPVERAKLLVLREGLPTRSEEPDEEEQR